MNKFRNYIKPNYADKTSKGLYDAKVGDVIEIGVSGTRNKREIKIVEVLASDKLKDAAGNIFNRNGMIYRGNEYWSKNAKKHGIMIYAVPLTKEKKRADILKRGRDLLMGYLKDHKNELTKEQIQAIGKVLNVKFTNLDEEV